MIKRLNSSSSPKKRTNFKFFDHNQEFTVKISHTETEKEEYEVVKKDILAAYPRAKIINHPVLWKDYLHITANGETVFCAKDGDGAYKHNK